MRLIYTGEWCGNIVAMGMLRLMGKNFFARFPKIAVSHPQIPNFTFSYGAGTKFKRNTGLYGTSDVNLHSQLRTIQKICPKTIWHFALKNHVHKIKQS